MFESSLIEGSKEASKATGPLTLFGMAVAVFIGIVMAEALSAVIYLIIHVLTAT